MSAPKVMCVGGATIDRKYRAVGEFVRGSSNPVAASRTFGGVARNVCETLCRLGAPAGLASFVGDDEDGRLLAAHLAAAGADISSLRIMPGQRTAEYVAILGPDGALELGAADMTILDAFRPDDLDRLYPKLDAAAWVFAECNLPVETLTALMAMARDRRFKLAVDPVSVTKSIRLPADLSGVGLIILNIDEARSILGAPLGAEAAAAAMRARGASRVIVTDGPRGVAAADTDDVVHVPAEPTLVADVTGAGDALTAAVIARLAAGEGLARAARAGVRIAALTIASLRTVRDDLSPEHLEPESPD